MVWMRALPVCLVWLIASGAGAGAAGPGPAEVVDLWLEVDGTMAHGLLAVPAGEPSTLVVITRGYTHDAESHRQHLAWVAETGAVGIAMDFAGARSDFPLARGAAETHAAIAYAEARWDLERRILFSVSMGAAVGAMVLADGGDAFDWWVASEPMANLLETYIEARALCPGALLHDALQTACRAAAAIENETGGDPDALRERTAVARVGELPALSGVLVVHGLNDGLVPYNQGRELNDALRAVGHATDFYTVARGEPGAGGTTITGYAGLDPDGLAGHGTESNESHTLTRVSWNLTLRLLEGDPGVVPAGREFVVDRELGTQP